MLILPTYISTRENITYNGFCPVMFEGLHFIHMGKHLHNLIISLRGEMLALKTCLTPLLFIEVPVSSHEILKLFRRCSIFFIFLLDFETVLTVWIFLFFTLLLHKHRPILSIYYIRR